MTRHVSPPDPELLEPALPAEPVYFGGAELCLFGWYHPAHGGAARNTGVVLCNPLGDEAIMTHATYRYLAEELARAGLPALRFDYHGTGDSAGEDRDPNRVPAWLDSIHAAVGVLKARSGVHDIGLFGVRLGATLAMVMAAERGPVSRLAVWSPCITGATYIRELRALYRMGAAGDTPAAAAARDGGEEAAGFVLTRSTLAELGRLDVGAIERAPAPNVLILARDDLSGHEERLAAALRRHGAKVTMLQLPGYVAMMREPHNSRLPHEVCDRLVRWLGAGPADRTLARGSGTATAARPAPATTLVVGAAESRHVREEAVAFGPERQLFGIVSTPLANLGPRARTAILLLNAGGVPHIGPNRMYVSLARRLAALGFCTLRFDLSSLGDSAGPGTVAARMYSRQAVDEVRAAMQFLESRLGIQRFRLIGLCSGAYAAFYTALVAPGVAAQVLINPQTFSFNPGDSLDVRVIGRRQLSRKDNWRKLLAGQIKPTPVMRALARQVRDKLAHLLKRGGGAAQLGLAGAIQTALDGGIDTLLVYSRDDPGFDYLRAHLGHQLLRLSARANFRLEIVDGPDHTFTPVWSQHRLAEIIVEHMCTVDG